MPKLDRITIFPIKSLDGHELTQVEVLPSGALKGDRQFALQDSAGQFVNGKRFAAIHSIRARFADNLKSATFTCDGNEAAFELVAGNQALAKWVGERLGTECELVENSTEGFPDDCDSPGPTLISTGSLQAVADWFPDIDLNEARRRFRMNLEIDSPQAFWEDRLFGKEPAVTRFLIGKTTWQGRGICQRCAVPSRNSVDGTTLAGFAKDFSLRRRESIPAWSPANRFDHFYRLGVNTAIESSEQEYILRVGDKVEAMS